MLRTSLRMCSLGASKYGHARTGDFTQVGPTLHNPFREDPMLERLLRRWLPQKDYDRVAVDLNRFGERIVDEIDALGRAAELNEPRLSQQDSWGRRVDRLEVCPEWKKLKEICAEEGLVALGYDSKTDPLVRRLHQIAKLYLFSPSAGLTTCPMAMTDGAAKTLKELKADKGNDLAAQAVESLLSRDGKKAWTSGQWMTEKKGGSDVGGGCDTYAVEENGKYRLYGYKWFSSAVDADVALTLAREVDKDGNIAKGTGGLTLFLLRIRNDDGSLNGIQMVRLKDKLGTRQLPTAELLLDGCEAEKVSVQGRGVIGISNMLNITRIHNAVASISGMRRIVSLARDYSTRRKVFGQFQYQWPLHTSTLCQLEIQTRGCFILLFEAARLLGLTESGKADQVQSLMLRLITPVLKLYAGKMCVPLISEGIECFGGQGYMEDTGLPSILRDAQVTPIWEGTTNVLSLDVLRVCFGKDNISIAFKRYITDLLEKSNISGNEKLNECKKIILDSLEKVDKILSRAGDPKLRQEERIDAVARDISFAVARVWQASLLLNFADDSTATPADIEVAYRYCTEQDLVKFDEKWMEQNKLKKDFDIVFENYAGYSKFTVQ
ncbi:unnamed protein product [Auanema sp. JU1783]|nr:unnamed protein product [Auanema sp. JU1783]